MLSEEEKKELLDAAASESLRKDFEIMRRNVLSRPMDSDALLQFFTAISRCFGPGSPPRHVSYQKALI